MVPTTVLALALLALGHARHVQAPAAAAPLRPEVVAFLDGYNQIPPGPVGVAGPSFWLDWPMADTVTTLIMQGSIDPFLVEYAHANGVRVLVTQGGGWSWLGNSTERSIQIQECVASVRAAGLQGFGFDFEHINSTQMPQVVTYVKELREAFPEGFLTFFTNGFPNSWGWRPWSGPSLREMEPSLDLVIAEAYTEQNDTEPGFPHDTGLCTTPCAVTSLVTVKAAINHHGAGPGGTMRGWDAYVPKTKLVLGMGWYMREWPVTSGGLINKSVPTPLGGRISFCQAVRHHPHTYLP